MNPNSECFWEIWSSLSAIHCERIQNSEVNFSRWPVKIQRQIFENTIIANERKTVAYIVVTGYEPDNFVSLGLHNTLDLLKAWS